MNTFLTEISEISARSYERRRKKTPIIYKKNTYNLRTSP